MIRPLLSFLLLAVALLDAPVALARNRVVQGRAYSTIRIGALLSLTGDGASLGAASQAALELAVRDINTELALLHRPFHVVSDVEDTRLTAAVAREKIEALHARGARFVIGPQSSAEAGAVLSYANERGVVVISQASTASSLAIAGDHLFRLAPNDRLEGIAQAALLQADGIDTIVPMWREDAGNTGLKEGTRRAFEALGGTVLPGISYTPATTDFTSQVSALGDAVRAIRNARPAARVAVYLASFEEAADIFRLARLDADLASVRWYGADGVTQSRALIGDANVAAFGLATTFTAPNVGLDELTRDRWQPLSEEIRAKIGFAPDAYALSVYDAAWVAILSAIEVNNEPELLRESFSRNVQRYWGVTGPTAVDAAGDRKIGNFDFWTIRNVNGVPEWVRTAQFNGRIAR
ncbi:MAG TPA: ABC transporter substrate-binding protein [Thermoanaerobaculia bacterium]|nr:ABC transporter substrate-binding protein [Thermoanaerobaculia bacterium]